MNAKRFSAVFTFAFLAVPALAGAQISASCPAGLPVTMSMTAELPSTVASASVGFHAVMQNTGDDVIRNATIAVDVVQKSTGATVDRFTVPQQVTLLQQSAGKADFVWKTSGGLASGDYTVRATLVQESTPLSAVFSGALSPSATTEITIRDGAAPGASISAVTVNGAVYRPYTTVRISEGNAQVVAISANGAGAPYKGTLTWRLYDAAATSVDSVLDTRTETVELHPATSTDIRYVLADSTRDGYFLEGQLTNGYTTRYIDIWLSRHDAVFPWMKCAANAGANGSRGGQRNAIVVIAVIAAVIALGAIWEFTKKRHA